MIYVISDTHLNHKNIIKYCNRPFSSVEEMNNTILRNWNKTVKDNDFVYLVGDLCFDGKRGVTAADWLDRLNGEVLLIRGNHDKSGVERCFLEYKGYEFLLVHRPYDRDGWNKWVISGHVHNNLPEKYPFINYNNKNINVCVEFLDYTPISIDRIIEEIEKWNNLRP